MLEDRIIVDQEVAHGKPIVRGSRVPVEIVLGSLAGGLEIDEVAKEYGLERQGVITVLGHRATAIASKDI
jgi:uncharacterized protein (DUF433 family)